MTAKILFAVSRADPRAAAILKGVKDVDIRLCRDFPFVLPREGLKMHRLTMKICKSFGFSPQAVYQSENLETVYSLINHNYGVGFLPDAIVKTCDSRTNRTAFFSFHSCYQKREIGLAYLESRSDKAIAETIVDVIQKGL